MRTIVALCASLSILGGAAPAMAVQGDDVVRQIQGERSYRVETPRGQRTHAQQPAWQEFLDRHGDQWVAQWDEATGTPARFWGEGWEVDAAALATDEGAFAISEAILAQESGLLGKDVSPSTLQRVVVDRTAGITTVTFQQTWQGLRVDETRLSLRFKQGRFVMGQVETLPSLLNTPTTPSVSKDAALRAATSHLGWDSDYQVFSSELVILPIRGESSVTSRLAWRFELSNRAERSHPVVWMDALDGRTIGWHQLIRHASGTVAGNADDRYPENGQADVGMRFLSIEGDDGSGTTDTNAAFTLSGDAPDTVSFEVGSEFFTIESLGGETTFGGELASDGGLVVVAPNPNSGAGAQRRQRAQLDIHIAAHIVRDRAVLINPSFVWAGVQAEVNVNLDDDACNAWFDPSNNPNNSSVNFLRQGFGQGGTECNNTGRVWDVMFHEYGHGFHIWNMLPAAGSYDGALGEGMGDYLSATINDDPGMARGFFVGDSNGLRNIDANRVWPNDIAPGQIHTTGLIIGSTLWDLRTALIAEYGAAGLAHADQIYLAITQRASDIPTTYAEAILADDDNGNLADGTPNSCLISEQFGLHGLGPGAGGDVANYAVEFDPVSTLSPGEAAELELNTFLTNAECVEGSILEARLSWSADRGAEPGSFEELPFSADGSGFFSVMTPSFEDGTYFRYFIELIDDSGDVVITLPEGSVTDPWYGAWVGGDVLWEDDFEDGDGGFTSELIEGGDQEGANDWMRERPKGGGLSENGEGGDPADAASGEWAWGNDLQPQQNWNGAYQNEIHNVLRSGPLDAGSGGAHLQFRRWLTVEDGFWDQAWIEVNGTVIWENHAGSSQNNASNHHLDSHWAFRSYDVTDLVEDGQIEVEWHLQSDQGLFFGGWTIDDVRVVSGEGGGVIPGDDDDAADDDDDAAGDDDDDRGPSAGGFEGTGCTCNGNINPTSSSAWALVALLGGLVGVRRRR
ncbi:MAG: hypothetical protein KDA24_16780 [Deltaproteobacteria bacterium]|nr:hypothetical protein [Deltaproteobacteria bacterium]